MSSKQLEFLLRLFDILLLALRVAPELMSEYRISKAKLNQLVQEKRDPTELEWKDLEDKINHLNNRLNNKKLK